MHRFSHGSTIALLFLFAVAWVIAAFLNPFPSLKNRTADVLFRETSPSGDLVLVKIDDTSIDRLGQWPWPREVFAAFVGRLSHASVAGIDVSFREPSRLGEGDDRVFEDALASSSVPIVLPLSIDGGVLSYPLQRFANQTLGGFSNLPLDQDGVVRRVYAVEGAAPSFSYAVASLRGLRASAVEERLYRIHFHGRNTTYPAVSFIDVLDGTVTPNLFTGKVVLVGVTASGLGSFLATPFGLMSSIEVHANAVNAFKEGFYYRSFSALDGLAVFLTVFISGVATLYTRRMWHIAAILTGILALFWLIVILLFEHFILLDPLYPSLAALGTVFAGVAYQFVVVREREQALRHAYDALNSMVAGMIDGIIMVDRARKVVAFNPQALRVLGMPLGEGSRTIAPSFSNIALSLGHYADAAALASESIREKKILSLRDVRIGEKFFQIIVAPVSARDSAGGAVFIFHDMTGEKELERVREDFTSMLVHELRSPLDVMRKMADVLNERDSSALRQERRKEYLSHISANAGRILELVNDLLDVAKIEAGKFELRKEATDIRGLIKDQIAFYTPLAESVLLTHSVDASVPRVVPLDRGRITQVLNNLISNALKFTPQEGCIEVAASLCAGPDAPRKSSKGVPVHWFSSVVRQDVRRELIVEVWNSGSTIAAEDIPNMFDKFKQFDAAARSTKKGTGLGLAIVRGITEGHRGIVGVASDAQGTSFLFSLPTE